MDKKCFIMMPTTDPEGYAQGHFDRVYQYIIVPACRVAGFSPIRADNATGNHSAWDLVQNIVASEMVICDLSSRNANVSYGFAIRHAMKHPVILMKDAKTKVDIVEFDHVEYDESLRIDTVQKEIETLGETLSKVFAQKAEIHALLSRLGIGPAQAPQPIHVDSNAVEAAVEEAKKEEKHLPVISPVPGYVGDPIVQQPDIDKLKVGEFLFHRNYGKGEIKEINKMAKDKVAKIQFDSGSKVLILSISGIFRKIKD